MCYLFTVLLEFRTSMHSSLLIIIFMNRSQKEDQPPWTLIPEFDRREACKACRASFVVERFPGFFL